MSLEIGYSIYKNDNGKLVELREDEINQIFGANFWGRTWTCGRNDVNYAWGNGYNFRCSDQCSFYPVFDKTFDNYQFDKNEWGWSKKLEYVDFEQFIKQVTADFDDKQKEANQAKYKLFGEIYHLKDKKKELRDLQKDCTAAQEFAFDKWSQEIRDIEQDIAEKTDYMNSDEFNDDYDINHMNTINRMIADMKEVQKKGYIVVPFYSD